MASVAHVAYIPLRAPAVNVIAIYSRARRKRRKPDSTPASSVSTAQMNLRSCGAMYCAMRGHFLRDMNAISICRSLSPFARYSKMRNGGGITFGTIPDTPHPCKSNDGRDRKASSSPITIVCGAASHCAPMVSRSLPLIILPETGFRLP